MAELKHISWIEVDKTFKPTHADWRELHTIVSDKPSGVWHVYAKSRTPLLTHAVARIDGTEDEAREAAEVLLSLAQLRWEEK